MSTLTTLQKSSADPDFDAFLEWCQDAVALCCVESRDMGQKGRGLVASRDLEPGTVICEIPEKYVISPETIPRSDVSKIIAKELASGETAFEHPHTKLVFLVLFEATNPNSFWKKYWAVMPQKYDLPSCWTEDQLAECFGSNLFDEIVSLNEKIRSSYDELVLPTVRRHPEFLSESVQTFEAYCWALYTVYSRQYTYDEESGCLVPFADLVNHRSELDGTDSNYFFDTTSRTFKVIVNERYNKGDEVFISYGRKSNEQYMLCYGFYNPLQSELRFEVPKLEVELAAEKDALMTSLGMEKSVFTVHPDESPDDMLKSLRILLLTKEEFETPALIDVIKENKTVNPENEQLVYYTVIQIIDWMLEKFPSTAEQDQRLVDAGLPAGLVRKSVIFRRKEKNALRGIRSLFEAYLEDAIENGAIPSHIPLPLHRDYMKMYEINLPLF